MTDEHTPRKMVLDPEHIKMMRDSGANDNDIQEMLLMQVVKNAIEEQLATPNGDGTYTVIIDAPQTVRVLTRSIAYFLGMSRSFNDPKDMLAVTAQIASELFKEACYAREAFREMGSLPPGVHIIESDDPGVSQTLN